MSRFTKTPRRPARDAELHLRISSTHLAKLQEIGISLDQTAADLVRLWVSERLKTFEAPEPAPSFAAGTAAGDIFVAAREP